MKKKFQRKKRKPFNALLGVNLQSTNLKDFLEVYEDDQCLKNLKNLYHIEIEDVSESDFTRVRSQTKFEKDNNNDNLTQINQQFITESFKASEEKSKQLFNQRKNAKNQTPEKKKEMENQDFRGNFHYNKEDDHTKYFIQEFERAGWFRHYFPRNNVDKVIKKLKTKSRIH